MTDVFSKAKRSDVMSKIRGRGNRGTELALVAMLRAHRVTGWRRHRPVFGKPDFVFQKERVAVFVDGCFWHCCPLHSTMPAGNRQFWEKKLGANRERDKRVTRKLRSMGWKVVRIWEHDLARNPQRCIGRLRRVLGRVPGKAKRH